MTICISIPGQGRGNVGLMSVTLSSQRFPLVKELKSILIGSFEFVYYLHAIHSVKLTEIVGVESSQCNLVRPPNCGKGQNPVLSRVLQSTVSCSQTQPKVVAHLGP